MKIIKQYASVILSQGAIMSMALCPLAHANTVPQMNNPPIHWTGFYGGLNMGVAFNDVNLHSTHIGFTDPSETCNTDLNYSTFFPGVQLGYVYRTDRNIVLGIEGSATINSSQSKVLSCHCSFDSIVSDQFSFKNRLEGSLVGRLGYALPQYNLRLLPFLTAGLSYADLGLNYHNESGDSYTKNSYEAGWRVGGGVEWLFDPRWSVRAEYFYVDYGNAIDMNLPTIYGLYDPNGHARANLTAHYLQVALNYWG